MLSRLPSLVQAGSMLTWRERAELSDMLEHLGSLLSEQLEKEEGGATPGDVVASVQAVVALRCAIIWRCLHCEPCVVSVCSISVLVRLHLSRFQVHSFMHSPACMLRSSLLLPVGFTP